MARFVYDADATFNWPPGEDEARVICRGAGGLGGVSTSGEGGGGGGAYSEGIVAKTHSTAAVVVGQGTAGNVDSSFSQGGTPNVVAKGGASASARTGGAGGAASSGVGTIKFSGGAGGTSTGSNPSGGGGGGGAATQQGNGTNGGGNSGADGGAGGTTPMGRSSGGRGGNSGGGLDATGGNGESIGGGAGGGANGANRGTPRKGQVIVYCPSDSGGLRFNGGRCCDRPAGYIAYSPVTPTTTPTGGIFSMGYFSPNAPSWYTGFPSGGAVGGYSIRPPFLIGYDYNQLELIFSFYSNGESTETQAEDNEDAGIVAWNIQSKAWRTICTRTELANALYKIYGVTQHSWNDITSSETTTSVDFDPRILKFDLSSGKLYGGSLSQAFWSANIDGSGHEFLLPPFSVNNGSDIGLFIDGIGADTGRNAWLADLGDGTTYNTSILRANSPLGIEGGRIVYSHQTIPTTTRTGGLNVEDPDDLMWGDYLPASITHADFPSGVSTAEAWLPVHAGLYFSRNFSGTRTLYFTTGGAAVKIEGELEGSPVYCTGALAYDHHLDTLYAIFAATNAGSDFGGDHYLMRLEEPPTTDVVLEPWAIVPGSNRDGNWYNYTNGFNCIMLPQVDESG